jgi:hypothetical protein
MLQLAGLRSVSDDIGHQILGLIFRDSTERCALELQDFIFLQKRSGCYICFSLHIIMNAEFQPS